MQVDKTTLADLSVFNNDEEQSILNHLNFTKSINGKEYLRHILQSPQSQVEKIIDIQNAIKALMLVDEKWPETVTNGTIMVIEKFYESGVEELSENSGSVNAYYYKIINNADYSLIRYSLKHFVSLIKGMYEIAQLLEDSNSTIINSWRERIISLINKNRTQEIINLKTTELTPVDVQRYGFFFKRKYKNEVYELIDIYSRLDAYLSLAIACKNYNYTFPSFIQSDKPFINAESVYHPLLAAPVAYNVTLNKEENFLFLTGANMAGKSTFIKAVGLSVYLAHIGVAVPAANMQLCVFDGLLSNIQIADNIIKGESYFFNEVQRIKATIEKINDGRKWLILIDELFKGTNVEDAMKCSTAVIEGLRKMQNAVFILSTHLYEIGEDLRKYHNIQFKYFETRAENGQLIFNYKLLDGISNDRLGYLILEREGVVNMLQNL